MKKRDVVAAFMRKMKKDHPEIYQNNSKMARMLLDSEDGVFFKNVEDARTQIRALKGANGKRQMDFVSEKYSDIMTGFEKLVKESKAVEYDSSPYIIKATDLLILSDLQYPYICNKSLFAAVEYAVKHYKIDAILINGDWFDFYQGSNFMKDPRKMRIKDELDGGCQIIKQLLDIFRVPIYFKYGNHEERFDNYISNKAGELKGIPEFELEYCLRNRLPEGVHFIKDKRTVQVGKLNIIHGHEYQQGVFSPVNPARGLWNRAMCSVLQGHSHQPSTHYEKNLEGKIFVTYSTGCLCDLKPMWNPNNKWLNGFARVEVYTDGDFVVHNKIIKNQIVY